MIWGFLAATARRRPGRIPELDRLVAIAVAYFRDFVAPRSAAAPPTAMEAAALRELDARLAGLGPRMPTPR